MQPTVEGGREVGRRRGHVQCKACGLVDVFDLDERPLFRASAAVTFQLRDPSAEVVKQQQVVKCPPAAVALPEVEPQCRVNNLCPERLLLGVTEGK